MLGAGVLGLLVAALLNADALVRDAEAKELGSTGRTVSLAVWRPLQSLSHALRLDVPRAWADEALGRDVDAEQFELPSATQTAEGGDGAATATSAGAGVQGANGQAAGPSQQAPGAQAGPGEQAAAPAATDPTAATQPPATETTVPHRVPTAEDPLDMWVVGDSMAQVFGESVGRMAASFPTVQATPEPRISTGLSRPDYFDWPGRLNEIITEADPDVMVVMYGANDAQGLQAPDGTFQFGEEGWLREYRARVAGTMDLLLQDPERVVIWVGQPSARDADFGSRMQTINGIFAEEAAARPRVQFVDTWSLLNDAAGNYAAFLPDDGGQVVEMRQSDGFHLSRVGGDRLALAVMQEIGRQFDLSGG